MSLPGFAAELKARPSDVSVRVKLLESLLASKKIEIAYNHVLDVEAKQLHPNNSEWYRCSTQVFKVGYAYRVYELNPH